MSKQWPPIPSLVVLYGQDYEIALVSDLACAAHKYGETNYYRHRIEIDGASSLSVQWATLCHEVLHVIDDHLALGLEEEDVRRLDSGIFEFIAQLGLEEK